VVGVVADTSVFGVQQEPFPEAYFPITGALDWNNFTAHILVRADGAPSSALPVMRSHLKALDSSLASFKPRSMEEVIAQATEDAGIQTWLLGSFAGLALLLAAVGLYSVLAYLVTQRTREIGIRMALGAQHRHVLRLVVGHGSKLTAAGLALGVIAALFLTRLMESQLFAVSAKDPGTFLGVVALMALVALAACYVPAYRAMRVEPMIALRDE
jgi:putative ABC transport system permease protein